MIAVFCRYSPYKFPVMGLELSKENFQAALSYMRTEQTWMSVRPVRRKYTLAHIDYNAHTVRVGVIRRMTMVAVDRSWFIQHQA